ncbi:MAG: phospho-N-acetylmuramoyl-pentapeptide-transferase [Rickettsiales bacterium]|nr:phospho-N-acetylmuramoyl-pentapeptide-transferase [Rickettsiales bacterium]
MINCFFCDNDLFFFLKIILSSAVSFLISFFAIKLFLSKLKQKFIQPIRLEGPKNHIVNKKNTPTIGGLFIVLATVISTSIFAGLKNQYILIVLFVFLSFAIIGLIDDLMKIVYKNPNGFRGSIKLVIQFLIVGVSILWLGSVSLIHFNYILRIPVFQEIYQLDLGYIYPLFITVFIVGIANAVNLTDGLDGLVSVPSIIALLFLTFLISVSNNNYLANLFFANIIFDSKSLIIFTNSLIFAIIGFLIFNIRPAKIFMGDVGSLAIGSALGLVAVIIKQEFIFLIIALLFLIEAASVFIQVLSYKIRKKRVFLMAPLHHHFEKKGWSENKVVIIFWLISIIFTIFGMLILYILSLHS